MIKIIGLGNESGDLSLRAHRAVLAAGRVVAKTSKVRAFAYFAENGIECVTLDEVFERSRNFDTLYRNLGDRVIKLSRETDTLVYCVEGSGTDDKSAAYILSKCRDAELLPACEKGSELLACCPSSSAAIYAAYDFASQGYQEIDHSVPLVIREIDSAFLASSVKLKLFASFSEETPVCFARKGIVKKIPLFELDRQTNYDYSSGVLLAPEDFVSRKRFGFRDLIDIVVRLRAPGGCPWDREQDHDSIRMNLLEEAYEALEAVEMKDSDKMREEMGDLVLQPVFHAVMGEESGEFSVADMLSELCTKLVFRHSHIFGGEVAADGEEALKVWERNKNIEKNQHSVTDEIRDVPKNFPALLYAYKVQKRAKKAMDFENVGQCFDKLEEEIRELKAVDPEDAEKIDDEGGDLLFAAVNVLRFLKAEPELALRHASEKFAGRIAAVEKEIVSQGKNWKDYSPEALEVLWQNVKKMP